MGLADNLRRGALEYYALDLEVIATRGTPGDEHVPVGVHHRCEHVWEKGGEWHRCAEIPDHPLWHQCVCGPESRRNGVGSAHDNYALGLGVTCDKALDNQRVWDSHDKCGRVSPGGHRCRKSADHAGSSHECRCFAGWSG